MQKMVTVGWQGAAPHIGEIYAYIPYLTLHYLTLPFIFFVNMPTDHNTEPISTHDISNDADCSKAVPFGGLIDEKNFARGNIPSPKLSHGILHANRRRRITFDM
jgi:hypothetical protein